MAKYTHKLTLGAVAYDPKVVTIWDGFRAWFKEQDFDLDFVLYENYERQVRGHFNGEFDVGWHSPLAFVEAERVASQTGREVNAFAMRDTDRDLTSLIVTSSERDLASLKGTTIAVGAADSPQATWIPLMALQRAGLVPGRDVEIRLHDTLLGKHGDHIGGERDAAAALAAGEVAAACMLDANHLLFRREGTLPEGTHVAHQTARFDHCVFVALDGVPADGLQRFTTLLLDQRYDDDAVRALLDLEGLKQWMPGRLSGFGQLNEALDELPIAGVEHVRAFIDETASSLA